MPFGVSLARHEPQVPHVRLGCIHRPLSRPKASDSPRSELPLHQPQVPATLAPVILISPYEEPDDLLSDLGGLRAEEGVQSRVQGLFGPSA